MSCLESEKSNSSSPQERTLRQYLEANNRLSQASKAIGQQMKNRRNTSRSVA